MVTKIAADPRIDPRIKAMFGEIAFFKTRGSTSVVCTLSLQNGSKLVEIVE